MIDPRIMVRELCNAYPSLKWFVYGLQENRQNDVLCQVYNDLIMRCGWLIEDREQWNAVPEVMGWNAPNFCRSN